MSNHCCVVFGPAFGSFPATALGRLLLKRVLDWLTPVRISSGKPVEALNTELSCQPPSRTLGAPRFRKRWPLPTGRVYNPETTTRCFELKSDNPYSHERHQPVCGCVVT